jgi:hypothetical protein
MEKVDKGQKPTASKPVHTPGPLEFKALNPQEANP